MKGPGTACWLWVLLCLRPPGPATAAASVSFVSSPWRSLSKTRQLLEVGDLRIMLPLGYELRPDLRPGGVLARRRGMLEHRVYSREDQGGERRLEIGVAAGLNGNYELVLYGQEARQVQERFGRLLAEEARAAGSGDPELGFEMYRLGYIAADRTLALLKALGYTTLEFAESGKSLNYEQIFDLVKDRRGSLPWIIKVVNAAKSSLLEPDAAGSRKKSSTSSGKNFQGAPQLGGRHLHHTTTGAPQERLLLVFDRNDPEALEKLINLIQTHIDVPAQQIVIEAQVIEINTTHLHDLGVEFTAAKSHVRGGFAPSPETGLSLGTFLFSRDSFTDFISFKGAIEALEERGDAEVLSSPSVLVLNDRQARIQVGRQIPVARTTATTATVTRGIEYFPIGIVLNLRPRINPEGSEVSMQIETIISSISPESATRLESSAIGVEFSPIIDNRLVETYVRVADGTPFIIGGLLSTEKQSTKSGIPVVSNIPLLGRLFSRERLERDQREVIVVLTPHIVPLEEQSFSYLIPKDSELFDRFDTRLFRNAYRVRDDDVWDLEFIEQSPVLLDLLARIRRRVGEDLMLQRRQPLQRLLAGRIPGEEVLVRRMLLEIVQHLEFGREVKLDQVFFFTPPKDPKRGRSFSDDTTLNKVLAPALESPEGALVLSYQARPAPVKGRAFTLPLVSISDTTVPVEAQEDLLWDENLYDEEGKPQQWAIVLANESDVALLRNVLVLKRVIELNKNLPQTLQAFRPGVQILFPTREDMRGRFHLVDAEVAKLFYETHFPYQNAERLFNRAVRQVEEILSETDYRKEGEQR